MTAGRMTTRRVHARERRCGQCRNIRRRQGLSCTAGAAGRGRCNKRAWLTSRIGERGDGAAMAAAAAMRGAAVGPFLIAVVSLVDIGAVWAQAYPYRGRDIDAVR